jgi:enterochelin esterase-like enzyme
MLRRLQSNSRLVKHVAASLLLLGLSATLVLSAQAKPIQQCAAKAGQMVQTTIASVIYGKPVAISVYLPPCYDSEQPSLYPVIYLLHGSNADETQWPDLTVQVSADALIANGASPFIVIMPGAAYYNPVDYSVFVVKELLPGMEARYRIMGLREGRGIGGLSMGGYLALKTAFLHPDLFAAVGGYSPVVALGDSDDPLILARQANPQSLQGLSIDLDVGDQDSLQYGTKELAQVLQTRGITVTLTIGHGGHNRPYWRAHTYDYLCFYLATFAKTQAVQPSNNFSGCKRAVN